MLSQLAYSEHKIYQATPTIPTIQSLNENLQDLVQNDQPQLFNQPPPPIQINPFPGFGQLQPPRPAISNEFVPRLESPRLPLRPEFPQQIYQQVFSQQSGEIPQDIYQQINQLGSQINFDEAIKGSEQRENNPSGNAKEQQGQVTGIPYANQQQNSESQGQKIDEQARESQQQSTTQQVLSI